MNTLIANRVQSAYSRPTYRSESSNGRGSDMKQRPKTSKSVHEPYANTFDQADVKTRKSSTLSSATSHRRRPKTGSSSAATSGRSTSRKLNADEIENLLQTLDRDDTLIVQLDCLANYRTLVQTIDLRKTPVDCQFLCALQQRENRIVQENACHDRRFRSLLELLQPAHMLERMEQVESDDVNLSTVPDYPHNNLPYESVK